jgi:hypothetical protein
MVILYGEGVKLAAQYGGKLNGIFSTISKDDWAEVLPLPN